MTRILKNVSRLFWDSSEEKAYAGPVRSLIDVAGEVPLGVGGGGLALTPDDERHIQMLVNSDPFTVPDNGQVNLLDLSDPTAHVTVNETAFTPVVEDDYVTLEGAPSGIYQVLFYVRLSDYASDVLFAVDLEGTALSESYTHVMTGPMADLAKSLDIFGTGTFITVPPGGEFQLFIYLMQRSGRPIDVTFYSLAITHVA